MVVGYFEKKCGALLFLCAFAAHDCDVRQKISRTRNETFQNNPPPNR